MNLQAWLQILGSVLGSTTLAGGIAGWFQRKNRIERNQLIKESDSKLKDLEAERERIGATAQGDAIRILRAELTESAADVERRRKTIVAQDRKLDEQDRRIDAMARDERAMVERIAALERWTELAVYKLAEHDIVDMPPVPRR